MCVHERKGEKEIEKENKKNEREVGCLSSITQLTSFCLFFISFSPRISLRLWTLAFFLSISLLIIESLLFFSSRRSLC